MTLGRSRSRECAAPATYGSDAQPHQSHSLLQFYLLQPHFNFTLLFLCRYFAKFGPYCHRISAPQTTMAEIVGVVGSTIKLVEQTIQTINRVRALRAFMGTVSDDLEEFLDDIEIVREVLLALTPEMLNVLSLLPLIERRLQRFQAHLTVLASVIRSERERVANRRLAKFKLYLKKDRLQKQRDSLDNIRQTLLLLQQTYFRLVDML